MIYGFIIEQSENIKNLGVVLNKKLNLSAHLKSLKSKLSMSCFVMSNIEIILRYKYCKNMK